MVVLLHNESHCDGKKLILQFVFFIEVLIQKIYTGYLDDIRTQDPDIRMASPKFRFTGD